MVHGDEQDEDTGDESPKPELAPDEAIEQLERAMEEWKQEHGEEE
jgi:hypothetical protein